MFNYTSTTEEEVPSGGTFYEGAITTGYTTDIADEAVHESIVSAGYGK